MGQNLTELWRGLRDKKKTFCYPNALEISRSDVIVVTEAPTVSDVRSRKLVDGQEGTFIKACLGFAGIPSTACYFTSVIKDADYPVAHYITTPKDRRQSPAWSQDGNEYVEVLRSEVSALSAKLIIAIGNVALCAATGRWGIDKWRGSLLPSLFDNQKCVMPILPPDRVFAGASENRHLIVCDLKKAVELRNRDFELTPRMIRIAPSYEEVMTWLDDCYVKGMQGRPISFDIEVKYHELNCVSFAYDPQIAISIPFVKTGGDYWIPNQEAAIMLKIAKILASSSIRKLGQNLAFDTHFMLKRYGIRSVNLDDTMIAQHALLPQFPKGLDMIASLWTDIPYYKDEGKEWFRSGGAYETLWNYNGLDSVTCVEAFPKIINDVIKLDNLPAYERQLSIIQPCVYMMERGIAVNMQGLRAERTSMEMEVKGMRERLAELAPGLNPQSPKQLQEFFYIKKGFPIYKNKEGRASMDATALKRIARQKGKDGAEVAQLISGIKKQEKLISTYMVDVKFDVDDRIRCSYNPCGTTFSRLSSSKSIFGTGMNMQNWPHRSLRHLKPDSGYVYYGIDLSQAENRIVAYVGKVENQIEAFENWADLHRITAAAIFNKLPEEVSDEPRSCELGTGEFSERDWGKKANHGLNYGFGFKAFALRYEMSEADSKRVCDGYHKLYPGVRRGFHAYVERCLNTNRVVPNLMGRKVLFLSDLTSATKQAAYASIPQGTVGDIINERGLCFLYYNKKYSAVELLQQVHDSIGFQIPLSLSWTEHASILWDLKVSLETPIVTQYGREFSIPADIVMSRTLHKESGIEFKAKKFPQSIEALAKSLEEGWDRLCVS